MILLPHNKEWTFHPLRNICGMMIPELNPILITPITEWLNANEIKYRFYYSTVPAKMRLLIDTEENAAFMKLAWGHLCGA